MELHIAACKILSERKSRLPSGKPLRKRLLIYVNFIRFLFLSKEDIYVAEFIYLPYPPNRSTYSGRL